MSSSYVHFHGEHIRFNDNVLQIWLYLMIRSASGSTRDRLENAWGDLARSAPASGMVEIGLESLVDDVDGETIASIAQQLAGRPWVLSRTELEQERIGGGEGEWTRDIALSDVADYFHALSQLIEESLPAR